MEPEKTDAVVPMEAPAEPPPAEAVIEVAEAAPPEDITDRLAAEGIPVFEVRPGIIATDI